MTTIGKSDGIGARIIVGNIDKGYWAPGVTIVGTEAGGNFGIARTAENLQPAIGKTQYARLNGIYRFYLLSDRKSVV